MPSANKALLEYEAAQNDVAMSALTNSGDNKIYTGSATRWSRASGHEPDVRPNGVVSGLVVTPGTSNNVVNISAGTAYIAGVLVTIAAGTATVTREVTNAYLKASIAVIADGTFSSEEGTAHASAHSDTRAADGGPPLIATTMIELAQVHLTSTTAAVIAASEIKAIPNTHREEAFFPAWSENDASGRVEFLTALMVNHTGPVTKAVHASYADPQFVEVVDAFAFVAAETSNTVNSTSVYNNTRGSSSSTIGQGGFSVLSREGVGVTDAIIAAANDTRWFRFYPVRTGSRYRLGKGIVGVNATYPADGNIQVDVTITADEAFSFNAS